MNPYLEEAPYWEIIHNWFIHKLAELHLPSARELNCEIDVERRVYQRDSTGQLMLVGKPDAFAASIGAKAMPRARQTALQPAGNVAVAQAVHEIVLEEDDDQPLEDYLVIRGKGYFRPVLAVVELLSPGNKDDREYCRLYRDKVREYEGSQTNFMEIDLLRAGTNPSREKFPELARSPYFIFVDRKLGHTRKQEGYPLRLQAPLPIINLPLGPGRSDLPLDLAATWNTVLDICWRDAWAEEFVGDPEGPLSDDDRQWVRDLMHAWRKSMTTDDTN
jgi:hypothetical protein